ncbi:NUDIX domain-containing protein [Streptomyces sp. G-G2]|uniref:NUDIX domain-containing protein n=1 Tax=Streptomyces sp. G-G2 TaxID=3046201 RepID=UPI0024B8F573|nr:NUDIX domain-containing protein [Streptomyces sp. G-G2]MDJ0381224.1 NUDIX domain-containing protein [Streptomyces sp. G-G2]
MTQKRSAGLLLFRRVPPGVAEAGVEVLLGHMGGPFWERRDAGAWSVPKGEYLADEAPRDAARREFTEEIGLPPPEGPYLPLGEVRQTNGKLVTVWAVEADLDPELMRPGTFTMEWPPGSGRTEEFPELDRVAWFAPPVARSSLVTSQIAFLERLLTLLHD